MQAFEIDSDLTDIEMSEYCVTLFTVAFRVCHLHVIDRSLHLSPRPSAANVLELRWPGQEASHCRVAG